LLSKFRLAGFAPGDAAAPPNARVYLAKAEEAAQTLGRVGLAIAVGHVDYRALTPGVARRYGSNQGLALQRAVAIQQMLTMTVITTVGGPVRTQQPVANNDLADDRAVDIYFFGTRNPP
jgi:flagellar motor protein MotB